MEASLVVEAELRLISESYKWLIAADIGFTDSYGQSESMAHGDMNLTKALLVKALA
ncbi:hypothetical protein [Prochlorococcus sp. MIT 0702]|uniref:hypothetical protein n=1 Tax=unclassified Prochlorococcus TaxID=2627481 RepID=UPI0039A72E3E